MRKVDIPLSAVDFHVSDIVPCMLTEESCFQPAASLAEDPAFGCDDAEALLKRAMWMYRSSTTAKRMMFPERGPAEACRVPLERFWKSVAPAADGFSVAYIKRRYS